MVRGRCGGGLSVRIISSVTIGSHSCFMSLKGSVMHSDIGLV